jgi:glycosyltransferase involved in cell wall biosynthesis
MKLLWLSNAPWCSTGYGTQTRHFAPLLIEVGHEVVINCFYGLEGGVTTWNGVKCLPRGSHPFGQDIVGEHARRERVDIIIPLVDAWVLDPSLYGPRVVTCPWFPVDSDPLPIHVLEKVRQCATGIVFSKFGQRKAAEVDLDVLYVPHGVDTTISRPIDRAAARAKIGLPNDRFVIGMVAANHGTPSRKALPQCLEAFAEFRRRHPEAFLYLHTGVGKPLDGNSVDLMLLGASLGILDAMGIADQYSVQFGLRDDEMTALYNSFDVLLSPSLGEGFGVPILEAQACGCPVIVGDWTAMSEIGFVGEKIPISETIRHWSGIGGYQFIPRVGAIVEALESVFARSPRSAEMIAAARSPALAYDIRRIVHEYWVPVLGQLYERHVSCR